MNIKKINFDKEKNYKRAKKMKHEFSEYKMNETTIKLYSNTIKMARKVCLYFFLC